MIQINARAKINLTVDILGRREDGYHEVKMVMQQIDLHDTVSVRRSGTPGVELSCRIPGLAAEKNLAYKAARLLMDTCKIREGVAIEIEKRIPVAAGLAGGSADAAGVLLGMNKEFALQLTQEELCALGAKIGSDVPFCISGGTMLAEGRGEKLRRLAPLPQCHVVLAKPPIEVSTAWAYGEYDKTPACTHPATERMLAALERGDLASVGALLENALENVTAKKYGDIARLKTFMQQNGALASLMSGSGPTVFALVENENTAKAMSGNLAELGDVQVFLTKTFNRETR